MRVHPSYQSLRDYELIQCPLERLSASQASADDVSEDSPVKSRQMTSNWDGTNSTVQRQAKHAIQRERITLKQLAAVPDLYKLARRRAIFLAAVPTICHGSRANQKSKFRYKECLSADFHDSPTRLTLRDSRQPQRAKRRNSKCQHP